MPFRSAFLLVVGVILGTLLSAGCTPDSSGSPARADTTAAASETAASSAEEAPRPRRPAASEPDNPRTVAERLDDASVEARIKQALVDRRNLRQFDVFPEVVRGRVVLRGDVDTREQYRSVERVTGAVEGVKHVVNQLTVDGEVILTNDDAEAEAPATAAYHTVEEGESLWLIARQYDVSVERIRALNSEASSLQPGQRIRIR